MKRCTHFVGFRGDEYLSAVRELSVSLTLYIADGFESAAETADGDLVVLRLDHMISRRVPNLMMIYANSFIGMIPTLRKSPVFENINQ